MPQTLFAQPAGARQPVDPAWAHGRAEALVLLLMSTVDGYEASGPLAGSAIWHTKISAPSAAMSSRQGSAGTHRHVYDSCYIASDPADTLYGWIRTLRARADKLTEHFWCPACRRAQSCSAARREHHHSGRTSSGPSERLGSSALMPVSRPQAVLAARGPFQGRFRAWTGPTRRAPSHANPRVRKRVKENAWIL